MKIENNTTTSTPKDFQEMTFSLENPSMIFEILRSKIYSDPIMAVVREYSCNALDAHREAGIPNTPIEISLPTYNDLFLKVRDFGLGISPDRMENVFVKYTASTKRNDNNAIGGFGLGAKVGFAVSNSFNATTVFESIKYNYMFYIDTDGLGKALLLSQEATTDPSGTTIIIPVKKEDRDTYKLSLQKMASHWKVKPLTNIEVAYDVHNIVYQGNNFAFSESSYYDPIKIKIVIDCIEYQLPIEHFNNAIRKINNKPLDLCKSLIVYFNIGELSLSVSRESVHLDPATALTLENRFTEIYYFMLADAEAKISSAGSFDQAVQMWKQIKTIFDKVNNFKAFYWNNLFVSDKIDLGEYCSLLSFRYNSYSKTYSNITCSDVGSYEHSPKLIAIYNDLKLDYTFRVKRLSKLLKDKDYKLLFLKSSYSKENALTLVPHLKLCETLEPLSKYIRVKKEKIERESLKNLVILKLKYKTWHRSSQKEFKESSNKAYLLEHFTNYVDVNLNKIPDIGNQLLNQFDFDIFKLSVPDEKESSIARIKNMISGVDSVVDRIKKYGESLPNKNELAFSIIETMDSTFRENFVFKQLRIDAPGHELLSVLDDNIKAYNALYCSRSAAEKDTIRFLYSQEELRLMSKQFLDLDSLKDRNKNITDKYSIYFKYIQPSFRYGEKLEGKDLSKIIELLINTENPQATSYSPGEF